MNKINESDDVLRSTTGKHGADISSQRLDDLDRACLRFAFDCCENGTAVDLGCGWGTQSIRLAAIGVEVVMFDLMDLDDRVSAANALLGQDRLRYVKKDARGVTRGDLPDEIDLIYSQRFFHYLRFTEASALLRMLTSRLHRGSQLFLSASGVLTELGQGYAHANAPVHERFCNLSGEMSEKHGIYEPVCLYDVHDLERLVEPLGMSKISVTRSTFGLPHEWWTRRSD